MALLVIADPLQVLHELPLVPTAENCRKTHLTSSHQFQHDSVKHQESTILCVILENYDRPVRQTAHRKNTEIYKLSSRPQHEEHMHDTREL